MSNLILPDSERAAEWNARAFPKPLHTAAQIGRMDLPSSLNPHPVGSPEYRQWFAEWSQAAAESMEPFCRPREDGSYLARAAGAIQGATADLRAFNEDKVNAYADAMRQRDSARPEHDLTTWGSPLKPGS